MKKLLKCLVLSLLLLTSSPALAQKPDVDAVTKVVESIKSAEEINYSAISKHLSLIEENLKLGNYNADFLSSSVRELSAYRTKLINARKQNEKELQFVLKRIEALGAPAEDGSEIETIAIKRKEFNDEASLQKAIIAETDVMLAKLDELDALILNTRNQELIGNLLSQQQPIIFPQNLIHSASLFINFTLDIIKSPINWYQRLSAEQRLDIHQKLIPASLIFILLLWLGIKVRLFIMRHLGYNNETKNPRFSRKVLAAILVAIAYGVIPACLIAGFMLWLYSSKIIEGSFFGIVLNLLLFYTLMIVLAKAFTRVTFAPYNSRWRLIEVDDDKAKNITKKLYVAIVMVGACTFLENIAISANYSMDLIAFISVLSSIIKGLFIIIITKILLLDGVSSSDEEDENDNENEDTNASENLNKAVKISFITLVSVAIIACMSLLGYVRLSAFIFNRFIFSVLIVGVLILMRRLLAELLHQMLFFKFWFKTFKLRRKVRMSIDFWSNMILDPVFIIIGIFLILTVWGVSTDLLLQSLKKLLTGFKVGGVNISLVSIALGIVVFFGSLALFKTLRTKFLNQVLTKMNIDDGIKHSLSAGMGFIGVVIAILIAIAVMGGDLTNLAIIASALSVGIGFGLQNIINNFVSGIIILFERPFKVGDWVLVNGEEGKIKQINIRSTEIETFKKASIIIPNATLISESVTNLTHENTWARQAVSVGVAYGSDVDLVKSILLEVAKNHKYVLKNPAPYVVFKDFGSSSLEFELRCYTNDIWNGWIIPSDLRFEINRRFIEEGIEIPFQQIVVHSGEKVTQDDQFYARKRVAAKNKK